MEQWPIYYLPPRPKEPSERARRNGRALERQLARTRRMLHHELPPDAFAAAPRVWIVAGGPSLKGFDFEQLRGEVVIGVNRAFEQPHIGICVSMDLRFYKWVLDGVLGNDAQAKWREFPGFKVFVTPEDATVGYTEQTHTILRARGRGLPPSLRDGFGACSNSGFAALLTAWALGAREIRLLGFDMHGSGGKQAWSHSGYPVVQDASCYDPFIADFHRAAPALKAAGIRVVNHSPDSALTCFPKASLESVGDVVRAAPERPVVCCYATRGTAYEAEAAAMVRSARAFGLETRVILTEPRGSWQANTYEKARIIRDTLRDLDQPILFVDADARFRRYPALFAGMGKRCDMALSWFDWDQIPGRGSRRGRELSSAVMFLMPCSPVFRMLDRWIALNDARLAAGHPAIEQRNLQEVVEAGSDTHPPVVEELPHTYNQIFDSMAACGPPVIEQMQASRRLKREVSA